MTSWVIVEKETGRAVLETFLPSVKDAVNTEKFKAVPIMDYLKGLNK